MKKLILALIMCFALAGTALAVVNINTATKDELSTLKGIGPKKAQAIIDYRKKNGDFKNVDDLEKVEGIGPGTMKQIRSQISVTGKTTAEKATDKGAKTTDMKKSDTATTKPPAKSTADQKKTEKK